MKMHYINNQFLTCKIYFPKQINSENGGIVLHLKNIFNVYLDSSFKWLLCYPSHSSGKCN